jgi:hypothetical protein
MFTISLTIGRNVGDGQMSEDLWTMFKAVTRATLEEYRHDAIECHEGRGTWGGVTEDSYKVTILATTQWSGGELVNLRREVTGLAWHAHQDAVAITRGESECIYSGRQAVVA